MSGFLHYVGRKTIFYCGSWQERWVIEQVYCVYVFGFVVFKFNKNTWGTGIVYSM